MKPTPLRSFDDIPAEGRILVYGTGEIGRLATRILRSLGREPTGYLDSFKDGTLDGLPVTRFETHADGRQPGDVVLICSSYVDEIAVKTATLDGSAVFDASRILTGAVHSARRLDRRLEDGRFVLKRG